MLCDSCPHRVFTDKFVAPKVWKPQPAWDSKLRFIRNSDLVNDAMELIPQVPPDIIGVIGVPVSGLIPAAVLSRMLCLPLYSFDHKEGIVSVGAGRRSRSVASEGGKYLVVDDTVYSGGEMRKCQVAMKKFGLDCIYAAVYTKNPTATDIYAVHAPGSIVLEWNIFNSGSLAGRSLMPELKGGVCCDFDGVICEEPPVNDVRQPDEFMYWLENARPQYIPRKMAVPLIVSFRIEPWREITEAWMKKWGVKAGQLMLHPAATVADRARDKDRVVTHKAVVFRDSSCSLMFESDSSQARTIADVSGKTVIVPSTGEIMYGRRSVRVASRKYNEIRTRNLLFHCCPLKANDGWRENVAKLVRHMDLFNGKKVVAIAISNGGGPETHGEDEVRSAFAGFEVKFVVVPNDNVLRERVSFLQLLLEVANKNSDEATFYAHTKGVATGDTSFSASRSVVTSRNVGSRRWRNAMYYYLLECSADAMEGLRTAACVGTTQIASKNGDDWKWPSKLVYGKWHFAGTFFWFRHDVVFGSEAWRSIPCDHYGVEAWLGGFIPIEDSLSLYQPWKPTEPWSNCMYDPATYGGQFDE